VTLVKGYNREPVPPAKITPLSMGLYFVMSAYSNIDNGFSINERSVFKNSAAFAPSTIR